MTEGLLDAIYFAITKHADQKRRDNVTSYVTHPLAVSLLLSKITSDQDVLIAGILHDVIEDTQTSRKEIETLFGKKVADLVWECTEEDRSLPWEERKQAVLEKIEHMSDEAALIKSADVLHNLYEASQNVKEQGPGYMNNFHASPEKKLEYEGKRLELLKDYHMNPLLPDLEITLKTLQKLLFTKPTIADTSKNVSNLPKAMKKEKGVSFKE